MSGFQVGLPMFKWHGREGSQPFGTDPKCIEVHKARKTNEPECISCEGDTSKVVSVEFGVNSVKSGQ